MSIESSVSSTLSYYKQRLSESMRSISGRSRWSCLPIRLPIALETIEVHPVYSALQDILNRTFVNLHVLDKALLRWDPSGAIKPVSPSDRLLLFTYNVPEPQTFGNILHLDHIEDAEVADKIRILYFLRHSLAVFVSQYYMEIDKFGETMTPDIDKPFGPLLITINDHFSKLEASICAIGVGSFSFDKLAVDYKELWPDTGTWDEKWSDANTTLIHENLNKLDMYISMVVSIYRKPRKITEHWMRYTFGAIGISLFSVWLIRHTRLSSVVDNWVLAAKKKFSKEQALTAARDEHQETMRNRQKERVQSTSDHELHRSFCSMLWDISQRTWVEQKEAKSRSARVKRRLLLDELEQRIVVLQNLSLSNEHGHYVNGLVLYTLYRLYKAVERHAKAYGEWSRVRDDLTSLGDPCLETSDKLHVISGLHKTYHCLQPLTRNELLQRSLLEQNTTWNTELGLRELIYRST